MTVKERNCSDPYSEKAVPPFLLGLRENYGCACALVTQVPSAGLRGTDTIRRCSLRKRSTASVTVISGGY